MGWRCSMFFFSCGLSSFYPKCKRLLLSTARFLRCTPCTECCTALRNLSLPLHSLLAALPGLSCCPRESLEWLPVRLGSGLRSSFLHKTNLTDTEEWVFAVDAVDNKGAVAVFVVILRDGLVLVLAGGVPDLHFDFKAIDVGDFVYKIEADGHHVVFDEFVLWKAEKNVGLADSAVADDNDLLKDIKLLVGFVFAFVHFLDSIFYLIAFEYYLSWNEFIEFIGNAFYKVHNGECEKLSRVFSYQLFLDDVRSCKLGPDGFEVGHPSF